MARIRSIKPEFPQSETIGKLSRDARLLFIQLWTVVDDEGRARAASRMLASLLYPYDDDARKLIDKWMDELEANKCIRRYVVDGSQYLEIVNWLKHQKIDHPAKSRLPEFASPREDFANTSEALAPDLGPRTLDQDKDQEEDIRAVAEATRPVDDPFEDFWEVYPKRDGANPKAPARKKFIAAVKSGVDPTAIIAAAKRSADEARSKGQIGTPYVPQAITWLNQQRWGDYAEIAPAASTGPPQPPRPDLPTDAELRAKYARRDPVPKAETAGSAERTDNSQELLGEGPSVHSNAQSGRQVADNRARVGGMRSLGEILQGASRLDPRCVENVGNGTNPIDDTSDPVAGVVRH
jgi:hypothetical protein